MLTQDRSQVPPSLLGQLLLILMAPQTHLNSLRGQLPNCQLSGSCRLGPGTVSVVTTWGAARVIIPSIPSESQSMALGVDTPHNSLVSPDHLTAWQRETVYCRRL